MPDFRAEIRTPWAATRVYDYIVDFRNLTEWHAAVHTAHLQTLDPALRNARYSLRAKMAGRSVQAAVVTREAERPSLIVAGASNPAAETVDRFEISTAPEGETLIIYSSKMKMKTPVRLIEPLMIRGVKDSWRQSAAELARRLEATDAKIG